MKKISLILTILAISLALSGCAGMSDTEQRTLSGAAIGTAAGGIVGAIAGHTGIGLAVENVPNAINIPLGKLRSRLDELPTDREIHVICRSGQRAYYATRILLQNGFKVRNVSGGMLSLTHTHLLSQVEPGMFLDAD